MSGQKTPEPIVARLAEVRLAWGLTIDDVADRTGIQPITLRRYERGSTECSPEFQDHFAMGGSAWLRAFIMAQKAGCRMKTLTEQVKEAERVYQEAKKRFPELGERRGFNMNLPS